MGHPMQERERVEERERERRTSAVGVGRRRRRYAGRLKAAESGAVVTKQTQLKGQKKSFNGVSGYKLHPTFN